MEILTELIRKVAVARQQFIEAASGLTPEQVQYKSSNEAWSIVDHVEHMVWAELGGINGMWKAVEGIKCNQPVWMGECIHQGLSIEKIVENTWQPKEKSPETARPKWGGPIEFWIISLNSCQPLLDALGDALVGYDLEKIIHPHPISGPLDVLQRMQFLRFHLNRHQVHVENIKSALSIK